MQIFWIILVAFMLDLASSVILSYKQAYYLKLEYQVKIVFHLVTQPIESSNFFLYDKFHGLPRSRTFENKLPDSTE